VPIRVLVADDEPAVREVLSDLLAGSGGFELVGLAEDTDRAVKLSVQQHPDVVLLDVRMRPSGGPAATREILAVSPGTRVVALSAYSDQSTVLEMLQAGAVGYVVKGSEHEDVTGAVRRAAHGEASISIETLRALVDGPGRGPAPRAATSPDRGGRRRRVGTMVRAQEDERKRIAGDIHDDSLQIMAVAAMRLGMVQDRVGDPDVRKALEQTRQSVQDAVARLRHLLFELRPRTLELEGLVPALQTYLEETLHESGTGFSLSDRLPEPPPPDTGAVVYRIAQEALINVRKHARATNVQVDLEPSDDGVLVRVTDDGTGFDTAATPETGHLGLASIRERAEMAEGWARISSEPGTGTVVEAWVPFIGDGPAP